MSVWPMVLMGTALGGALIVWHNVSKAKHISEEMLRQYREMLSEARRERARKLAEAERGEEDAE